MTPLRVAYVLRVFPKISETFVASELAEVRRRGVEVRILSLRRPAEEVRHEIVARAGLDERTVYDPREFPVILREFRPQLLHAHFATAATAKARELAAEIGIPFTFTAHRYDVYDKAPADFADRAAAAGAVVTVSEANLRHIVKAFGVPAARIHVIPCGVDTERFQPDGQRAKPQLIEDGVTGFLTTPGDAGRLAGALERLLLDPDLVARFGAAARRRVVERFSLTRQVDRLLALWRRLAGEAER